jgi:peptidoglycan/xylan/chitin deacetylase (PgdA/CDA1 family)
MRLQNAHGLRGALPVGVRCLLYEWHPTRGRRWRRLPGLERVPPGCAVVTLDDGPDPDATPEILDQLDRCGVRATFFMLGEQVVRHAALAREVAERGHDVALHGSRHLRHDRIAADEVGADIALGLRQVEEAVGVRPRWFRPAYGKASPATADACAEHGLRLVYWSTWGLDWERLPAERIARRVCRELDDGAVVLLHDSARYARRPSAVETAGAIPIIADTARRRGLSLIPLTEAVA